MESASHSGVVTVTGKQSLAQTVRKVEETLRTRGLKLFDVIDHGGEAEKAGLYLRPTKLLIFGGPKAGTPLMVAAPTSAIDLPLKILVWVDDEGRTQISYNSAAYLATRHSLPPGVAQNIDGAESLVAMAAE